MRIPTLVLSMALSFSSFSGTQKSEGVNTYLKKNRLARTDRFKASANQSMIEAEEMASKLTSMKTRLKMQLISTLNDARNSVLFIREGKEVSENELCSKVGSAISLINFVESVNSIESSDESKIKLFYTEPKVYGRISPTYSTDLVSHDSDNIAPISMRIETIKDELSSISDRICKRDFHRSIGQEEQKDCAQSVSNSGLVSKEKLPSGALEPYSSGARTK